jgi:hypothetical protein
MGASGRHAAIALRAIGDQLACDLVLPPRLKHGHRAECTRCKKVTRIERVSDVLCGYCIAEASQSVRFDRLLARHCFDDDPRRDILEALRAYELGQPKLTHQSWLRAWGLCRALRAADDVRPLRTWTDVGQLRAQIAAVCSPAVRHKAHWALHKVCIVLLDGGYLDPRPPKTTGSPQQQLLAVLHYFFVEDEKKRELLQLLVDFYATSRVTVAAVTV